MMANEEQEQMTGQGDALAHKLHNTTDGQIWAQEFMRVVESGVTVDEGLMLGWFANAIETGRSAGHAAAQRHRLGV